MPRNDEVSQQPNDRPSGIVRFEPILDSTEAAALLKIHPKTLQKMARSGKISGFQVGKLWRFRLSALYSWFDEIAG